VVLKLDQLALSQTTEWLSYIARVSELAAMSFGVIANGWHYSARHRQKTLDLYGLTTPLATVTRVYEFNWQRQTDVHTGSRMHLCYCCTGKYRDTREDQVNHERTGGAQSTKTYKRWGSAGRKQRWQLLTDTDGVGVWSNVSSWMQDESTSRSKSSVLVRWTNVYTACISKLNWIDPSHVWMQCYTACMRQSVSCWDVRVGILPPG